MWLDYYVIGAGSNPRAQSKASMHSAGAKEKGGEGSALSGAPQRRAPPLVVQLRAGVQQLRLEGLDLPRQLLLARRGRRREAVAVAVAMAVRAGGGRRAGAGATGAGAAEQLLVLGLELGELRAHEAVRARGG